MATGRIGTTPVLTTRWSKAPSAGTTSLSGLDDNSVSLVYSVGYEAVYQNGVLLSRGNDYTATNGTTITLTTATVAGDIIEVFANQTIPLTDTYSQTVSDGRFIKNTLTTTTGDIIYASAANTPARLGIGSTSQVLTVSGGVPAWATPSSGGMTSLASGNINNSVSLTSISGSYNALYLVLNNYVPSTADTGGVRINNDTTATNYVGVNMRNITGTGATVNAMSSVSFVDICAGSSILGSSTQNQAVVYFPNYANTSAWKVAYSYNGHNNNLSTYTSGTSVVAYRSTSAITRLDFVTAGSSWNTQGTYELFGVK